MSFHNVKQTITSRAFCYVEGFSAENSRVAKKVQNSVLVMVKNSQILNSLSECSLSIKPMKNPFLEFEFLFGLQILLRPGIKLCYSVLHKRGNVRSHRRPVIAHTHCGPITVLPHRLKDYVCARHHDEMKLCV